MGGMTGFADVYQRVCEHLPNPQGMAGKLNYTSGSDQKALS